MSSEGKSDHIFAVQQATNLNPNPMSKFLILSDQLLQAGVVTYSQFVILQGCSTQEQFDYVLNDVNDVESNETWL